MVHGTHLPRQTGPCTMAHGQRPPPHRRSPTDRVSEQRRSHTQTIHHDVRPADGPLPFGANFASRSIAASNSRLSMSR